MKNFMIAFVLLIATGAYAQFPGYDVELFRNATVAPIEIKPIFQRYAYRDFYTEMNEDHDINILKGFSPPEGKSKYETLVGKEFKVVEIYEIKGKSGVRYTLVLSNEELGTLYYSYSPEYESSYELEFKSEVILPPGFYCKNITTDIVSKSEIWYNAPPEDGIFLSKVMKSGKPVYYVMVAILGASASVNKKGLVLTLEGGTKISKPTVSIDVEVTEHADYRYTAMVAITAAEMKMIGQHPITASKLYIYDNTVLDGAKLSEYAKCLLTK